MYRLPFPAIFSILLPHFLNLTTMEIIWHGDTSSLIREKGNLSLAIDPQKQGKINETDIVLTSLPEAERADFKDVRIFDWPGEYETKSVPIQGIEVDGPESKSIIFRFDFAGVRFCHIGALAGKLDSETITEIGDVDILMIKVGQGGLSQKHAMEIIEEIQPRAVIPMGEGSPVAVMKEVIPDTVEPQDKIVLKGNSDLSEEKMEYFILNKA